MFEPLSNTFQTILIDITLGLW